MTLARLLEWQWQGYPRYHGSRTNLLIHIVAVPLFQLATLALLGAALGRSLTGIAVAIAAMLVALVLQGRGHRREAEAPTPFDGAADFVSRFVGEQWVTFPRFVRSGAWHANLQRARRPR